MKKRDEGVKTGLSVGHIYTLKVQLWPPLWPYGVFFW